MDTIAVLDFGGQYAHLIANRIRRLKAYSEILDGETPAEKLKSYKGIIFSGGPQSVYEKGSVTCDPEILKLGLPILGICYGHQLLAYIQGAKVEPADFREFGLAKMKVLKNEGIFKDLNSEETVWMSHGDSVKQLPPGYEVIGESPGENAAIADFKRNFYGVQFHVEVAHTLSGMKMLQNFLDICGVKPEWKLENFIEREMNEVKKKVGDKKVFMMMSGGVDSSVAFALLSKALGPDRVKGLLVDTGFMRYEEAKNVMNDLKMAGLQNVEVKDASAEYFQALKNIYKPEEKRKIIGDLFLEIQSQVAKKMGLNPDEWLLGQGTIYPDTIESGGTRHAAKIKTHHNRVPQIEELIKQGKIIEPLAQLYKDEVREVGQKLGLPESLVWRHPFPGPGLAVRCLCLEGENYPENYAEVEEKINNELSNDKLKGKILPIQSVGVQGDFRTYRHPLAIMGANYHENPGDLATRLINQHREINRVIWLVDPTNIEEIFTKKTDMTPERIKLLQKADMVVNEFLIQNGLMREIWQFPTVLIPISINKREGESIVLRPVQSEEAMTANFYMMKKALLQKLAQKLREIPGVTAVFYDITHKPPGTIEWE